MSSIEFYPFGTNRQKRSFSVLLLLWLRRVFCCSPPSKSRIRSERPQPDFCFENNLGIPFELSTSQNEQTSWIVLPHAQRHAHVRCRGPLHLYGRALGPLFAKRMDMAPASGVRATTSLPSMRSSRSSQSLPTPWLIWRQTSCTCN